MQQQKGYLNVSGKGQSWHGTQAEWYKCVIYLGIGDCWHITIQLS